MAWKVKYRDTKGIIRISPIFLKKNSAEVWFLYLKCWNEMVEGWIEEV
ncbi:hypothetical protein [Scytonema hofmannii]|nr:hypothetical protein [Scytonema hofmannii]